ADLRGRTGRIWAPPAARWLPGAPPPRAADRPGSTGRSGGRRTWRLPPRPSPRPPGPVWPRGPGTGARASFRRQSQDVPHTAHRMDQAGPRGVDLLAQVADVGLHHVGIATEVVVPHVIEDLLLREHPLRIEEQEPQQLVFGGA